MLFLLGFSRHHELLQRRLLEFLFDLLLELNELFFYLLVNVSFTSLQRATCQCYDVTFRSALFATDFNLSISDALADTVHIV